MPQSSRIDKLYRSILLSKYFIKGWGHPNDLKKLLSFRKIVSNREKCFKLVPDFYPLEITKDIVKNKTRIIEGSFISPFDLYLPDLLPKEVKKAHFQMILPSKWKSAHYKPICLHMAGTGDQYFWRRRVFMAKPLLEEAEIGSIILENPFYGLRKPFYQTRSVLHNVMDIFIMGGCLILEALVMFHWCKRNGLGPLGVTGLSMGGHGVMSKAINWDLLRNQFVTNEEFRKEIMNMIRHMKHDFISTAQDVRLSKKLQRQMENLIEQTSSSLNESYQCSSNRSQESISSIPDSSKKTYFLQNKYSLFEPLINRLFKSTSSSMHPRSDNASEDEAKFFMEGIMDDCTHIGNFSVPVDTSLIISICALEDAYVPRDGVTDLKELWPGSKIHYVDCGHVSAFILYRTLFRRAIIEGFERYKNKYLTGQEYTPSIK